MPGWAAATEALQRGKHHASSPQEAGSAAIVAGESLALLERDTSVTSLMESISLAATVRKLVWPHTQRQNTWLARECLSREWLNEQILKLVEFQVPHLWPVLVSTVLALNDMLHGQHSSMSDGGTSSTSSTVQPRAQPVLGECSKSEFYAGFPKAQHSKNTAKLHQLLAITLATLVQICFWRAECEGAVFFHVTQHKTPAWLTEVITACKQLHTPDLKILVLSLLRESILPVQRPSSEVSMAWDRYAVSHFHGRFVPGCSCLGCTNMSGCSEAALKTQLCSGCRKARYCSTECQKAAWLDGGHSTVCEI